MKYLIIISFLLVHNSFSQNIHSKKSSKIEIKGWELFFKGEKSEAKFKFEEALKIDSNNLLAKIGLYHTKKQSELTESDSNLYDSLPAGPTPYLTYSEVMFTFNMMRDWAEKYFTESQIKLLERLDEGYVLFKAQLLDTKFSVYNKKGNIVRMGKYKNRKPSGIWKSFDSINNLKYSFKFSKKIDTVVVSYYKPNGVIIKKDWLIGMPFTNRAQKYKEIIYWQEKPGKDKGYFFISKDGFKTYDKLNPIVFDESTPDNFIQMIYNPRLRKVEAFIWKNGEKKPFEFCNDVGIIETIFEDEQKESFRWENCKLKPYKN